MLLHRLFGKGDVGSELDDVIRNLGYVLKTKRGSGYFLPNFGLSDAGYRTPEEMVTSVSAELRETITVYEPRVEFLDVDESYDDDRSRPTIVVSLRLRATGTRLSLRFDMAAKTFSIEAAG
jgi:phage baseplate assembly protein W